MISIVLIEPSTAGNVGFTARAMKNFGLKDLVLINPKCELKKEAIWYAKHAKDIIKKTKTKPFSYLKKFDYLIGTTASIGYSDFNIPRSPLTPKQLAKEIPKLKNRKIALIFGREGIGLKNNEIKMCDIIVAIPTSTKYKTMNISHAASIIFYELFQTQAKRKITDHITPASKKDKEVTYNLIKKLCDQAEFSTPDKKNTQLNVWKRILGKSFLTKRETFAMIGFFKKFKK